MSYTMNLVDSMMKALIEQKIAKGYTRLNNGLFEDCVGQVYSIQLSQSNEVIESESMSLIKLELKPVNLIGRI